MIERVARQIYESRGYAYEGRTISLTVGPYGEWGQAISDARAAIEALRRPTRDMVVRGSWASNGREAIGSTGAENAYRIMIEAALGKKK